ncbi:MAG: DUF2480 family protein [Sphingobacteriia bacterium]|jgi:hypothetical protein|nr:DUF2480 family protein [Sphingobacteriia bacterium]
MDSGEIINKVAQSGLVTFNLQDYYTQGKRQVLDIQEWLFKGLMLKEKEFREFVKAHDWSQYSGGCVSIICSADAIVPTWAYMLIATKLQPHTDNFVFGSLSELETELFVRALSKVDFSNYTDAKIVIKGCSEVEVPIAIYVEVTRLLMPFAAKLMYGEPCSTVPLWKKDLV